MVDFARLVLVADTTRLKPGVTALDDLTKAGGRAERATDGMTAGTKRAGSELRAMASTARLAVAAMVALGAAIPARAYFNAAEDYARMTNGLRAMGASSAQAAAQLQAITDIALRTRSPLDATAQLYTRISIAAGELGASQQQVLGFTENVGLALGAAGISANEASGALLQLSQAMAGGTVRAEEFNSILENAFPLAQAAARGIDEAGGSVGRLRQLVVDGEISSREFFDAIMSQGDALQATFAQTEITVGQAFTNLGTAITSMIGAFDQSVGVTGAVAKSIDLLAQNLDSMAGIAISAASALVVTFTPAIYGAVTATAAWIASLVTLKGALIATGIGALVVGAGLLIGEFIKLVRATGGFGNALTLLGDVASGVWEGIKTSASSIGPALASVWETIKAGFMGMLQSISKVWADFLHGITGGMANIPGMESATLALSEAAIRAGSAVYEFGAASDAARANAEALKNEAASLASEGFDKARDAVAKLNVSVEGTEDAVAGVTPEIKNLDDAVRGAGGAASKTAKELDDLTKRVKELNDAAAKGTTPLEQYASGIAELEEMKRLGLSDAAYSQELERMNEELANSLPMVNDVANAFGDFIARGLSDFKGFAQSILKSFQSMIAQMIATAARNRILLSIGATGSVAGTAAQAAPGVLGQSAGILGGILGTGGTGLAGLAGSGGILGGVGSIASGLGGIFSGGGLGASFANLGGLISGATSGLGALGAALPALGIVAGGLALVFGAFKKKVENLDSGIRVTIDSMDAIVETFSTNKTTRFFGLSKKTRTSVGGADPEVADPIIAAVAEIQTATLKAADALGIAENAFDGFATSLDISLKGLSEEQAMQAITEGLNGVGSAMAEMIPNLDQFRIGSETAGETLFRLSNSLQLVNSTFAAMDYQMFAVSMAGADMASSLVNLLGGLQGFSDATSFFVANFYTDAEQLQIAANALHAEFAALNMTTPQTAAEFRALVEAQDLTTEAGQQTYAALMKIAPAFSNVAQAAANAANIANQAAAQASGAAAQTVSALNAIIPAQQSVADAQAQAVARQADQQAALCRAADAAAAAQRRQAAASEAAARAAQAQAAAQQAANAALQKAAQIADERFSLETRYLQAIGDVVTLREREIAALDPANQAFGRMVIMLEDAKKAADALSGGDFASQAEFNLARARALNLVPNSPPTANYSAPLPTNVVPFSPAQGGASPSTSGALTAADQRELIRLLSLIERHTKDTARGIDDMTFDEGGGVLAV